MRTLLRSSLLIMRRKPNYYQLRVTCLKITGIFSLFLFCFYESFAQPTLVKDINTDPAYYYNNSLGPQNLTAINGVVYFNGSSEKTGRELWRSDGTAAGTYQVKDINPGISSSNPSYLLNINGTLFFIANYRLYYNSDESGPNPDAGKGSGFELWKSDGTFTGTVKIGDFFLVNREYGWLNNIPVRLMNVDGTLFFTANNAFDEYTLYKSDGTPAGTQPVTQVKVSDNYYSTDAFLGSAGKYVYYNQLDPGSEDGHESLWRTDGTQAGTIRLLGPTAEESYSLLSQSLNINGTLYFSAPGPLGQELWKSNGTPAGTVLVKDIVPGPEGSNPTPLGASANILYFSTNDALWKSDGTAQGTVLVKNGIFSSGVITGPGGQVYFSAQDATHGYELWKSDGTSQGTVLVKDINPGPGAASSSINDLLYINGLLYFTANNGVNGRALWKSDGTTAGTLLVKDINPGTYNYAITDLIVAQNTLFFSGQTTQNKPNLWKSDGTAAGTVLVKEPNETIDRTQSSAPATFTNVNGLLYFTTLQPKPDSPYDYTYNLWKSDGTGSGTILLKQGLPYAPEWPIGVENTLFFSFNQTSELWKSDGSPAGTQLVKDINGNLTSYYGAPRYLTRFGGKLVFAADDGSHGNELWKSDGTAAGTILVKDINPGPGAASSFVKDPVYLNGLLYFAANDGVKGQELWKSDGTAAGTLLVKDINSGSIGSDPGEFILINTSLFFVTKEGTQKGLWKTDGTSQGTVFIKNVDESTSYNTVPEHLTNVNGTLYFTVKSYASQGVKIWKSNGTAQGTTLVKTISMGFVPQILSTLDVNGTLYFIVANEYFQSPRIQQLWKSDGTEAGTIKIEEDVTQLGTANGALYFTRNNNLWKSNGTPESAMKVADLSVFGFASIGKRLYLTADDGKTGNELWKYDSDACPAVTNLKLPISGSTICQTQPATITIDQSQTGVLYQARLQNNLIGEPVKGTGGKITLPIPVASLSTGKNTFYISAIGCTVVQLTDSVVVTLLSSCPPVTCSATGSILQEKWLNVTGYSVGVIPVNTTPSSSTQLTSFETTPNQGDNYGERIRGYLCAPYSGNYTFYIAGDDQCELYLSSDEDPAKKTKIASVVTYSGNKEWNKFPSQKSALISLVAGKKYYIEALHKEATGGDHLAVGWQTPAQSAITLISGSFLSPFIASCSNTALSSHVVNPSSGGILSGTTLYLKTIPGASSYTLQVSTSADFTTGVITKTTASRLSTGTYYAAFPELSLNQKYYVRVYTNLGLCWGPVTSFTTASATGSAYVVNPSDGGTTTGTSLYLNTVPGATTYTLQVSTSSDFTTGLITRTTASRLSTGTYYAVFPELSPNQKYYVRVKTNLSDIWGRTTSFTTASAAGSAFVVNPCDGGTTTGTSLYLNTVPGATTYTLQVSTSSDFTTGLITRTTASRLSTGTYYAVFPELSLNQKYYVRVKTNLSEVWGRTTSFTRVSATARLAASEQSAAESLESKVSIYPNPFETTLTLSTTRTGTIYITVVDNLGRVVFQSTTQGTQTELNLSHLKAGVYVIKVSTEDGQTQVLRVVKQ